MSAALLLLLVAATAREIYAKARPGYHPIAVTAIDALLRFSQESE